MVQIVFIVIIVILICSLIVQWYINRRRNSQMLDQLLDMVQDAIDGTLKESHYDESKLTALESKLYRFIRKANHSEERLSEERDKIKTLIGDIAHQTKTPIANLMLYGQLLAEMELPADSRGIVSQINEHSEKLGFLIESLMKTSRLETGVIQLQIKTQGVIDMLQSIYLECLPKAKAKGILLTLEGVDMEGLFDPKWAEEAVHNIVDNAVKYTPEGGKVTITTEEYEQFCRINISDNGPGIEEAEINKIFQRFYRSHTAGETEGVGIGLYLAREIIVRQNGYIRVVSKPGEGAVFSVFLPKNKMV